MYKRQVIYLRVSSEKQVKNTSLASQEKACRDWCRRNGFEVVDVYIEKGVSAKTVDRTEFQKMLKFVEKKKSDICAVVFWRLNRFSRKTEDTLRIRRELYERGIKVFSVNENLGYDTVGNLLTTIISATNQFENECKADNTRAGIKARVQQGRWPHKQPIGYLPGLDLQKNKIFIFDPERAELVKLAFELLAEGVYAMSDVLRKVSQLGLTNPKTESPINPQTFARMVRNPFLLRIYPKGEKL